jgi:hypothetical protein
MKLKLTPNPGTGSPVIVKIGRRKAKPLDELAKEHGLIGQEPQVDVAGEMLDGWITEEETRLGTLDLDALIAEHQRSTGRKTRSVNRKVITAGILKHLREQARPDPEKPEAAKSRKQPKPAKRQVTVPEEANAAPNVAPKEPMRARDPRIPAVGLMIERLYKGKTLLVMVLDDGFEYEGKPYRSLSALAQAITGAKAINGHLFFRLGKYAKTQTV